MKLLPAAALICALVLPACGGETTEEPAPSTVAPPATQVVCVERNEAGECTGTGTEELRDYSDECVRVDAPCGAPVGRSGQESGRVHTRYADSGADLYECLAAGGLCGDELRDFGRATDDLTESLEEG